MSGFICPECASNYLKTKGEKLQCELCGWVGENDGSRAWLTNEAYEENAKRLAAIKSGKLFILRIRYVGTEKQRSDDISETMDILKINGMSGGSGPTETNYKAELQVRPANDVIAKIKKLKTVKDASVWP